MFSFYQGYSFFPKISPEGEYAQRQKERCLKPVLFLERLNQGDAKKNDEYREVGERGSFHMYNFEKRRGRDSNPREDFSPTGFRDLRLKPLSHPSKFSLRSNFK